MIRLLFDECVDRRIINGLLRQFPRMEYETTEVAGLNGKPDPEVLELFIAAAKDRKFIMGFTNGDFKYKPRKGKFPAFTDGTIVKTLKDAIKHLQTESKNFRDNVTIEVRGGENQRAVPNQHALIYELPAKP